MANRHRGEIEADIGGARRRLVLTLGALAELEDAFGAEDLVALTERFGSGRLTARDLTRIIGAGLRGAGDWAAQRRPFCFGRVCGLFWPLRIRIQHSSRENQGRLKD